MGLNKKRVKEVQVCMESRKMVQMSLLAGQKQRHKNEHTDTEREGAGETHWKIRTDTHALPCVTCIAAGELLSSTGSSARHGDDLQGWDGRRQGCHGRVGVGGRGYMYAYSFTLSYSKN